jgi:LuxR family maltose regulon positive regulatory protein
VISGVAGSGKTSLVCQWILRDRLSVAWYSLDETDNEGSFFYRYLLATVTAKDPRLASAAGPWLHDEKARLGRDIMSGLIEHFVGFPGDLYLVLDDYHFITSRKIHDAIIYLLNHMPATIHVVITSRYNIPFSLSRFKVRNEVVEISASDIRFTEEETEQFFEEIIPVNLTIDEVHEVARHTEGWVGGLQLFGLTLKGKEVQADFGSTLAKVDQEATDFLVDEVINVQPARVRAFLQATALLDRFNADVAREVTGMVDSPDILDRIYRNHLFLISLDTDRKWYRYHHLFSEAVRGRARVASPDLMTQVYRQSGLWFAKHGYLEDAFRNAFASEDFEFAADLMEDYLLNINDRYEYASGGRWLAKLPHNVFMGRVLLRLHDCGQKTESFQLADIEATIKAIEADQARAFDRYEGRKKTLCQDLFIFFRYVLYYYYRNPAHPDVEKLDKAFQMISPENRLFSGYIKILIALSHVFQGNPPLADAALKEASPPIFSSESLWARMLWFRVAATVERMQGHLRRSEAILMEAFEFLQQKGLSHNPLRFVLYLPLAWILYQRNDLEGALKYATDAAMYWEHVRFVRDMLEGNLLLSLIHSARGDREGTDRHIQKMVQISKEANAPEVSVSPDPWVARLSMLHGDIRSCERWSEQRKLSMDEPFSFRFFHECMTQAELFYRQGRYREAARILESIRVRCAERHMLEAALDIDLALCATLYALKERDRARGILEKALDYGEGEGYVRPFVNCGPALLPILSDIVGAEMDEKRRSYLVSVFSASSADRENASIAAKRPAMSKHQDLTQREMEILKLMAAGYRNKEIAERTFVSFETIKTHVKHIFEKLDATTRVQAIRRAEELKLLENR